jgi:hypothetical protein
MIDPWHRVRIVTGPSGGPFNLRDFDLGLPSLRVHTIATTVVYLRALIVKGIDCHDSVGRGTIRSNVGRCCHRRTSSEHSRQVRLASAPMETCEPETSAKVPVLRVMPHIRKKDTYDWPPQWRLTVTTFECPASSALRRGRLMMHGTTWAAFPQLVTTALYGCRDIQPQCWIIVLLTWSLMSSTITPELFESSADDGDH